MIRKFAPIPLLFTLSGCAGYSAVWYVEVGTAVNTDPILVIEHNFLNAAPPVDDTVDEWTTTGVYEASNSLMFAEIFEVDGSETAERVMVANGTIIPGLKNDDGLWEFIWINSEGEDNTESHTSGYMYTQSDDLSVQWTFTIPLKGKEETGTLDILVTQASAYTETDVFSSTETEMAFGQIPAETFLDSTTEGDFVFNAADATDCSGTPCSITATQTLTASAPVSAWRTNIDPDGFDGIDGASQEAGVPDDLFGNGR